MGVSVGPVQLRSPVLSASGCFGSGKEMSELVPLDDLGAVVCKTVTLAPRAGISPPRAAETPSGMLNAIGLQNPGVEAFVAGDLRWLADRAIPAIASAGGHTVEEYVAVARALDATQVLAIELNLSCPNLENRGFMFALDAARAAEVTRAVKEAVSKPVFVKLSPDVTDLPAVAAAVADAGADALSLINTTLGMAIDVGTMRPKLSTGTGGLSGPALKPIALRCVFQVAQALPHVPIVGIGGIASGEDAIEFVLAGATAVQVGTANFYDPRATSRIAKQMEQICAQKGVAGLHELRGRVKLEG